MSAALPRLNRLCAAVLAIAWVLGSVGAALHERAVQHAVCDEHGVVEDLAAPVHLADHAAVEVAPQGEDDEHDACHHVVAVRELATPLTAPPSVVHAPAPPLIDRRATPPVTAVAGPRGPPLLQLAAKTSPPRA